MTAPSPVRPGSTTGRIAELAALGQSAWFDNIRRGLLTSGEFEQMVREDGLTGVTSNPSIFEKAIVGSTDYDEAFAAARAAASISGAAPDVNAVYEALAITDLRQAMDVLRPVYEDSEAVDGYVSMEVSPDLAHDTAGTVAEAQRLWAAVDRPNLMIKVPGTTEGIPAIRQLIAQGINVNITLLFSIGAYERVVEAYLAGLEDRLASRQPIDRVASVASFFISRIDSAVDPQVTRPLQGKVGIANAKLTYLRFRELFAGERWHALHAQGAHVQRVLWASTSTKNPTYSDVYYVESLIGPDTVDTIYPATYEAFQSHGVARVTLTEDVPAARAVMDTLAKEGVDIDAVADGLLREGVEKFIEAQAKLLDSVRQSLQPQADPAVSRSLPSELEEAVGTTIADWQDRGKVARLWAMDAELWTGADEASWLGWLTVAMDQLTHAHRFGALAEDVRASHFDDVVVLGMGGSSLCPEVLALTFSATDNMPRLRILDSTDPQQIQALEEAINLARTLFFVSSKSGTTLEPNIFAAYFQTRVIALLGADEAARRFIAITDPDSPLEQLADRAGYRAVFHGWPTIGGRYSALSDFGMIPGVASGVDAVQLLDRAERMAYACAACVPATDNPGLALGAVIGVCAAAGRDKLTLVSSPGIRGFGAWLEQLLAESTGKNGKGVIPVDREPLGPPDVYGADRVFIYLRRAADNDATQDEQVSALEAAGHPVIRIVLNDRADLGGEFFRWEFATAVAGSILGINPFNQPDVEDAKIATRTLTDAYDDTRSLPDRPWFADGDGLRLAADARNIAELRDIAGATASVESLLAAQLGRVQPGDYVALLAYLPMTTDNERLLTDIRVIIRDRLHVATCVGFGPRFQHSTGQAYKGGPNSGVFLQLTCTDTVELPVPGHAYTFGVVKEAQARGDFDALAARGRRALRVDLGSDPTSGLAVLRDAIARILS
jgi:transaldolase / glucose-6-phosphate isomerase